MTSNFIRNTPCIFKNHHCVNFNQFSTYSQKLYILYIMRKKLQYLISSNNYWIPFLENGKSQFPISKLIYSCLISTRISKYYSTSKRVSSTLIDMIKWAKYICICFKRHLDRRYSCFHDTQVYYRERKSNGDKRSLEGFRKAQSRKF